MLDLLKDFAEQYFDGLISIEEFQHKSINELCRKMPDKELEALAEQLLVKKGKKR